ncbi:MAG: hypothetical protein WD077_05095 [Bacteroidia bacterium]
MFDKDGVPIISNRGEGCQITARNKLKDLGIVEFQIPDGTNPGVSSLDSLFARVSNINKSALHNEIGYDYTVVYTWAKYLPEHSIEMMEAVNEGLRENKANVLLISLNLDFIDTWTNGKVGDKIELD